jgi:hypothetical protein
MLLYRPDPAKFVRECFTWKPGEGPADYQAEVLGQIQEQRRVSVRGPHGLGKTALASWIVLWFALTRDCQPDRDWKVVMTASVWRQLSHYLLPELRKWARRLDWNRLKRDPFVEGQDLLQQSLKLYRGEAFPVASNDPSLIEGAHADSLLYIFDESKCLDVDTPIPTPTGWKTLGEIQVGDEVLGEDGRPCRVLRANPIQYGRKCYRVTFEDGETLVADDGHLWAVLPYAWRQTRGQTHRNDPRYRKKYEAVRDWREHWDATTLVETTNLVAIPQGSAVPTCRPVELPEAELPIDPYTLGAWLGDGHSLHGAITSAVEDSEIAEQIQRAGFTISPHHLNRTTVTTFGVLGLRKKLQEVGVLGNKHIPLAYLRASTHQRLALLRGLMDTDGTRMGPGEHSRVSFTSTRKQLAEGVAELVRTFGWKVTVREQRAKLNGVDHGPVYILRWSADLCPFHLSRKASQWVPRNAQGSASTIRTIRSIEEVESVPVRCLVVNNSRHLFLAGRGFIPTHNSIIPATFDAAEGALSVGDTYAVAISTPGEPQGRFYEIQSRKPGTEDWWVRHVTKEECIAAGRMDPKWAEQRRLQWGEGSAVYQNRVEGQFATSDEDGVIPLSWVEAANERWAEREASGDWGVFERVGVDVARSGNDETVYALRYGKNAIKELRHRSKQDLMATTGEVVGILNLGGEAVVDIIGLGAGVYDRLTEQGLKAVPFNASEGTDQKDSSGELGFVNKRSAGWWNLREMLDPANGEDLALPPDDLLTGDLTAPHWKVTSGGKIQVESKEDIGKRIGRSTDSGDAVVQAFWMARHIAFADTFQVYF